MRAKILVLSLILLLIPLSGTEKADVLNYGWEELFTEPCEIVYFIMKDGQPFRISSRSVKSIHVPIEELKKRLKNEKEAYEIKDIAIVIHNHQNSRKFSPGDWQFYRDLKRRGFDGQFLMYCHMTNKTYNIEDKVR